MSNKPVKLTPVLKDYLWGGTLLANAYHKAPPKTQIAESWELSVHPDGTCSAGNMSLVDYLRLHPGCLGKDKSELGIMIKLIDAAQALSIQVHPDNDYARKYEHDNGKTEMWVVLQCQPDAKLYYGLKRTSTKAELQASLRNDKITELLNNVPVKPGDVFFIEPGTIHAIGAGIVICEIQQSSNVTYRLYDFQRRDAQGQLRQLHLEQALAVCRLEASQIDTRPQAVITNDENNRREILRQCAYFTVSRYQFSNAAKILLTAASFTCLVMSDGQASFLYNHEVYTMLQGDTYFLPAQDLELTITGKGTIITVTI
ncbi:MAG: type I phosphomannose isomerase catalytic subunit [Erysipelotrichaceae bacterium]|nr:type I phosphomannose isomerase catalytic subunit [Erysipelotrichaceae bacterium]